MTTIATQVERITQAQANELPSVRFFENHRWNLDGLKQCCPFIMTTGQHEGKAYATTRAESPAHYVYADTELDAAYKLLIKQFNANLYSGSFGFKIQIKYSNATAEMIEGAKMLL